MGGIHWEVEARAAWEAGKSFLFLFSWFRLVKVTFVGFFHDPWIHDLSQLASFKAFSESWWGEGTAVDEELCAFHWSQGPNRKHGISLFLIYLQAVLWPNYCSKKVAHCSLGKVKYRHYNYMCCLCVALMFLCVSVTGMHVELSSWFQT